MRDAREALVAASSRGQTFAANLRGASSLESAVVNAYFIVYE